MPNSITIRPLKDSDISILVDILALKETRFDLGYYSSDAQADTIDMADFKQQAYDELSSSFDDPSRLVFAIHDGHHCVGEISLFEWDRDVQSAQLLMYIHPNHRHRGYGAQALRLFLNHLASLKQVHRLSIEVFGSNIHALHLYESVGFAFEGIKRDASKYNDSFIDIFQYAWIFAY